MALERKNDFLTFSVYPRSSYYCPRRKVDNISFDTTYVAIRFLGPVSLIARDAFLC